MAGLEGPPPESEVGLMKKDLPYKSVLNRNLDSREFYVKKRILTEFKKLCKLVMITLELVEHGL